MNYPEFMDWPTHNIDNYKNILYIHPKNKSRQVLYAEKYYNTYDETAVYDKTNTENTAYYYGSKLHRINGPALIEKRFNVKINTSDISRLEKTFYQIEWRNRNILHRKDAPASYNIVIENGVISRMSLEWHQKPEYYFQGSLHRLNGPAIYRTSGRTLLQYFIRGKRYNEYDYWNYMLNNYPKRMPRIISADDKKIAFETDLKKPAPKAIYKKIKKVLWSYEGEIVSATKYWSQMNEYLKHSQNWLILS